MTSRPPTPALGVLGERHLEAALAINQHWVPHVGSLEAASLAALVAGCDLALGAFDGEELAGFVLVLGPGADYSSPNYRWFSARHDRFAYVDRIAVSPTAQGSGVGRALYRRVEAHARERGVPVVCAEVNLDPPNPDSQAFHSAFGFVEVGRQWTYGDTVEVQMLELAL